MNALEFRPDSSRGVHRDSVNEAKAPIPRLRISISIRIAHADNKWNKLNNVGAILIVSVSG